MFWECVLMGSVDALVREKETCNMLLAGKGNLQSADFAEQRLYIDDLTIGNTTITQLS